MPKKKKGKKKEKKRKKKGKKKEKKLIMTKPDSFDSSDNRSKLRGRQLENYKKSLVLTDFQKDVIIGTLLGDSSMSIRSGKPHYSIKFEQGEMHKEYIFHLYEIFKAYVGSPPTYRYIDKAQTRKAWWFRTYRHEHFAFYYHLFYHTTQNGKKIKIVPENIKEFLTPVAVAYWFMDDGTFTHKRNAKEIYYLFSTHGFFHIKKYFIFLYERNSHLGL
jgi:hypothetical protein